MCNNMHHTLPKGRQQGFTMVELAVALAIVAILVGSVFSIVSNRMDKSRAAAFAEEIVMTAQNLQQRHATQPSFRRYEDLSLSSAKSAMTQNLWDSVDNDTSPTLINLDWGATATLEAADSEGGSGDTNQLWTLSGLPSRQCEAMLEVFAAPSETILAGGDEIRSRQKNVVLSVADLADTCSSDDNSFEVVF